MNDVTEEEEDKETRQVLSNRVMPGQTFKQSRDRRRTETRQWRGGAFLLRLETVLTHGLIDNSFSAALEVSIKHRRTEDQRNTNTEI